MICTGDAHHLGKIAWCCYCPAIRCMRMGTGPVGVWKGVEAKLLLAAPLAGSLPPQPDCSDAFAGTKYRRSAWGAYVWAC